MIPSTMLRTGFRPELITDLGVKISRLVTDSRKVHKGDKIIIVAYATYNDEERETYKPTVVLVDDENAITDIIEKI